MRETENKPFSSPPIVRYASEYRKLQKKNYLPLFFRPARSFLRKYELLSITCIYISRFDRQCKCVSDLNVPVTVKPLLIHNFIKKFNLLPTHRLILRIPA
jgi:hypothetical protein